MNEAITCTAENDIKQLVENAASGDVIQFPDGEYDAGDEIILIDSKRLHLRAMTGPGNVVIKGSFLIGGSWDTRFDGVDIRCQDGKQTLDCRLSDVIMNDARMLCDQDADPLKPIYLQHANLYLTARNRNLIFPWAGAVKPCVIDMLYGSTVFAAGWGGHFIWFQTADQGQTGTVLGLTQGGGTGYLHNVRIGSLTPAGEGNGVTCVTLQRDSSLRFLQDSGPGTGLGCQNAGVGVSLTSGSEAVLEGADGSKFGRIGMCNLGYGVSRFGPADKKDVELRNINWDGTPPGRRLVNNSTGWSCF